MLRVVGVGFVEVDKGINSEGGGVAADELVPDAEVKGVGLVRRIRLEGYFNLVVHLFKATDDVIQRFLGAVFRLHAFGELLDIGSEAALN